MCDEFFYFLEFGRRVRSMKMEIPDWFVSTQGILMVPSRMPRTISCRIRKIFVLIQVILIYQDLTYRFSPDLDCQKWFSNRLWNHLDDGTGGNPGDPSFDGIFQKKVDSQLPDGTC